MLKAFETRFDVSGKGATPHQAFADALASIKQVTRGHKDDVFIQIEPLSIEVLQASETVTVRKFLFFFLPRERRQFFVKLGVHVRARSIDISRVEFVRSLN